MKLFIKIILKHIIYLLFVTTFLNLLFDFSLKHSEYSNFNSWNLIFNSKIKAEIVIQGSSRAKEHFNINFLDSILGKNIFNFGMEGTGFDLQYARFLCYLTNNKKPKYIIQNIDCSGTLENSIYEVEQYLPYFNNTYIKKAILESKIYTNIDFYLPLFKYSHNRNTIFSILNGIQRFIKHKPPLLEKYQPQNKKWDTTFYSFKKKNKYGFKANVDKKSITEFNDFLNICKNENIKVIFVYTPEYIELQKLTKNRDSIINIFKDLSIKYNVPILDYSKDSICLDTINFYNSRHMNAIGVNKFNLKLGKDLNKFIE